MIKNYINDMIVYNMHTYKKQGLRYLLRNSFKIFIHNFRTYLKLNCHIYLMHFAIAEIF